MMQPERRRRTPVLVLLDVPGVRPRVVQRPSGVRVDRGAIGAPTASG
jgi:hypothetical protein